MDLQTLSQLFATTYNPDPNVRKAAELEIRKVNPPFQFGHNLCAAQIAPIPGLPVVASLHRNL